VVLCEEKDVPISRIDADLLIPGKGDPIPNGVVLIQGNKILYAGASSKAPTKTATSVLKVPVIMPGMWDCHCHFIGSTTPNFDELVKTPVPVLVARCVPDALAALNAGFTSLREPGGFGIEIAKAIQEGSIPGPNIYSAGKWLSITGGHGDLQAFPCQCVPEFLTQFCDGVPECTKAVRLQLRRGVKLIKIHASGGVLTEIDHPIHQQFSDEEMKAICDEAARAERVVAAHCHGKPGIMAALHAGCKTIEHGTYLDDEAASLMLKKGAILVPTRTVVEVLLFGPMFKFLSPAVQAKALAVGDLHRDAIKLAIKKGVKIASGSDIFLRSGAPGNSFGRHGL